MGFKIRLYFSFFNLFVFSFFCRYGKFLMRMIANQGQPNFIISITPKKLLEKSGRKEKKDTKSDRGGKSSKTSNQKNMKNGKITEEKVSNEVVIGGPGEWTVLEEEGGVSLYVGKPGSECGVAVDASSYFDRYVCACVCVCVCVCVLV